MVNEYGYKLIEYSKDKWGYTYWKLSRENVTDDNKNMNESYEITHSYTLEETLRQTNDCLLPKLSFLNLEPIFKN
jgi:hypothetical protein